MFRQSDILDEKKSKILREKSKKITFPLNADDKSLINDMIMYLRLSQDEEYAEKNNIRAGMGLAAVQLGVLKRFFVISYKKDDGTFEEYKVINPEEIAVAFQHEIDHLNGIMFVDKIDPKNPFKNQENMRAI